MSQSAKPKNLPKPMNIYTPDGDIIPLPSISSGQTWLGNLLKDFTGNAHAHIDEKFLYSCKQNHIYSLPNLPGWSWSFPETFAEQYTEFMTHKSKTLNERMIELQNKRIKELQNDGITELLNYRMKQEGGGYPNCIPNSYPNSAGNSYPNSIPEEEVIEAEAVTEAETEVETEMETQPVTTPTPFNPSSDVFSDDFIKDFNSHQKAAIQSNNKMTRAQR